MKPSFSAPVSSIINILTFPSLKELSEGEECSYDRSSCTRKQGWVSGEAGGRKLCLKYLIMQLNPPIYLSTNCDFSWIVSSYPLATLLLSCLCSLTDLLRAFYILWHCSAVSQHFGWTALSSNSYLAFSDVLLSFFLSCHCGMGPSFQFYFSNDIVLSWHIYI